MADLKKFEELVAKLKEIFQLDKPELDFGIYRILHARQTEINDFLEKRLKEKVGEALAGSDDALAAETDVYSNLLKFFSRYYEEGDFISQRRYNGDKYAIPYAGEEVKLHWANADQYYIKSGENFTNYDFTLENGRKVHFKLVSAATAKDNVKDADARCFVLWDPAKAAADDAIKGADDADDAEGEAAAVGGTTARPADYVELKGEGENAELFIYFEYKALPKDGKKKAASQKDLNKEAADRIFTRLSPTGPLKDFLGLVAPAPTEGDKSRKVLGKHLADYTAKNTSDYFIHKDLKGFLSRELDFYVKNEMMNLDDIQKAETVEQIGHNLKKIQCVRAIASELIDFMAQLEEFQKKLWLKKKFVTRCEWCITLDRVPEELREEVFANAAQKAEWERLGLPTTVGSCVPHDRIDARMVDTKFYDESFKAKLLAAIPDLDAQTDGVIVKSENFQALNLLQERYRGKVKCIYIDPPYNTGSDGFIYKDGYSHSSWLAMMRDRMIGGKDALAKNGVIYISIDDNEVTSLRMLCDDIVGKENFVAQLIWQSTPGSHTGDDLKTVTEDVLLYAKVKEACRFNNQYASQEKYVNKDEYFPKRGGYVLNKLDRRMTGSHYSDALNYAIQMPDGTSIFPGSSFEKQSHWNWRWSATKVKWGIENGFLVMKKTDDKWSVYFKQYEKVDNEDKPIVRTVPFQNLLNVKGASSARGTAEMMEIFGDKFFDYPKPLSLICHLEKMSLSSGEVILDYFAGSGTTGHAVIALNREDCGKRKYVLVEMGDHFETVLKPRLEKVVYSPDWKDGKPTADDKGVSHCFKYLYLESYEDALTNLVPKPKDCEFDFSSKSLQDEFVVKYLLDLSTKGSVINTDDFKNPFAYTLDIASDSSGATTPTKIDLVETFNYLMGFEVVRETRRVEDGHVLVEVRERGAAKPSLVVWRDVAKVSNDALNKILAAAGATAGGTKYASVYVNGDHAVPNQVLDGTDGAATLKVRQIEEAFLTRMFAEA